MTRRIDSRNHRARMTTPTGNPPAPTRKASYLVGAAVMISRVLGLAREIVFSSFFGGTRAYECFIAAFRLPNLLRDLFA